MFSNYPDMVTIDDLCKMMRVCKHNAYGLIKNKEIPSMKVGKKILIPKEEVIVYIRNQTKIKV